MDIFLSIVLIWLCLTSMNVFTQIKSYGHLMVSLGAALTLATFLLLNYQPIGWIVLISGRILFFGGFAVIATFERIKEQERFRVSSWKEIFLGIVPEHLHAHKVNERSQIAQALLVSLLFAIVFYLGDRQQEALSFLVIAIVFGAYLVRLTFRSLRR